MDYRIIQTLITDPDRVDRCITVAAGVAKQFGAHLDVLAIGVNTADPGFYYAGAPTTDSLVAAQADTKELHDRANQKLPDGATLSSVTVLNSALSSLIAKQTRFADLIVLPRPYQEGTDGLDATLAEACLFQAERPVLMLPDGVDAPATGGRIVLAWNDGNEALSAARHAMPYLKAAAQVDIVMIDPPQTGPGRSDPGGQLSMYLTRHGVKTQLAVVGKNGTSIAEKIQRKADDVNATMIVMGGYGHSRLREAVFGGSSRDMLETCRLPLLMAR